MKSASGLLIPAAAPHVSRPGYLLDRLLSFFVVFRWATVCPGLRSLHTGWPAAVPVSSAGVGHVRRRSLLGSAVSGPVAVERTVRRGVRW